MTILIGITCKDGIVLAGDSQTTKGTSKRCDAKKFAAVEFNNARVLVAQAGDVRTSSRAIEILRDLAKGQTVLDYRTVADLAQTAMRRVKEELRAQNCDCSLEELRDFILRDEVDCELMIAHCFRGKPYIFTVDLVMGIATKANSHYLAIGCGANLGEYLLAEHSEPEMDCKFGSAVAVYAVETVKRHDAFCGGPTRVAIICLGEEERVELFDEEEVAGFAKEIDEIHNSTKEERNKQINKCLRSLSDRHFDELFRLVVQPKPPSLPT